MFKRDHVGRREPVVLHALAADWPAVRHWTFDYLAREFATVPVTAAVIEEGRVLTDPRVGVVHRTLSLGEFVRGLRAGGGDRYVMTRMEHLPDGLRAETPVPPYVAGAPWLSAKLWISATGMVSYMHRDLADNLHVQVVGHKRFTLVSPGQSAMLYPRRLSDSIPNGCAVDIEHPDVERFPRSRSLQPMVAELAPGDAIYIPRRWWHHVRTLEASASVNFWWADGVQRLLVVAGDTFKRLRGISR